jgi:hypothetical protein
MPTSEVIGVAALAHPDLVVDIVAVTAGLIRPVIAISIF